MAFLLLGESAAVNNRNSLLIPISLTFVILCLEAASVLPTAVGVFCYYSYILMIRFIKLYFFKTHYYISGSIRGLSKNSHDHCLPHIIVSITAKINQPNKNQYSNEEKTQCFGLKHMSYSCFCQGVIT